jgi:rhodanese-related sulfurtransferase
MLAGALAPLVGSPFRGRRASVDVDQLAGLVDREEDHVAALELAAWIRARRPGLRILDVRSRAEYDAYHVPGAEHVPLAALPRTSFAPGDTIVVYSEAGVHGAQAWVFLRALGHHRVYFLRRGILEWLDEVMSPAPPPGASDAEAARIVELSRSFGGVPRPPAARSALPARGRGC